MQVISSINNKRTVESLATINEKLKECAGLRKNTSDRYSLVDTEEVVARVLTAGITRGYHAHSIRVSRRRRSSLHTVRIRFTALAGDVTNQGHPELVITNSYNGESSLRFHLGFYRLICSNGLTVPMPGFEDVNMLDKKRHVKGPKMNEFTRHLDERIAAAFEGLAGLASRFARLESVAVTPEQEEAVISSLALGKRQMKALQEIRRGAYNRDTEHNLWALYNAVNEAIRRAGRSEFAAEMRNVNLLQHVEEAHAQVA